MKVIEGVETPSTWCLCASECPKPREFEDLQQEGLQGSGPPGGQSLGKGRLPRLILRQSSFAQEAALLQTTANSDLKKVQNALLGIKCTTASSSLEDP